MSKRKTTPATMTPAGDCWASAKATAGFGYRYVTVKFDPLTPEAELEADAIAIRALPDLYAACKLALELSEPCGAATPEAWAEREAKSRALVPTLRAAVAKAEARQQAEGSAEV